MGDDTHDFVKSCWQGLLAHVHRQKDRLLRCRACGKPCTCFSDMCENCGTSDPVVLPTKYLWAPVLFAVIFLILAVRWL